VLKWTIQIDYLSGGVGWRTVNSWFDLSNHTASSTVLYRVTHTHTRDHVTDRCPLCRVHSDNRSSTNFCT